MCDIGTRLVIDFGFVLKLKKNTYYIFLKLNAFLLKIPGDFFFNSSTKTKNVTLFQNRKKKFSELFSMATTNHDF
jgi:hypothetical protein